MSGGCKVLLILGILFGVLILLCCGGIVTTGWYFARATSDDPGTVRAVTEQMVEIELPQEFQPAMSIDFKVPFSGKRLFSAAVYADEDSHSMLTLASIGKAVPDEQREQVERQIRESLRKEGVNVDTDSEEWESWERELDVRGQKRAFTFAAGKDAESGTRFISATGQIDGKQGPVILMFAGDAEKSDEERVVRVIESIR
jgi:hypothetical protein